MNKIKVLHVGKKIGEQIILDDINLEFEDSKIYGLIGRNGSGKTVLLKCIAGFMKPSEGEIWLNDKKIGKDVKFIENMGFILNTPGFLSELSGFKNLQYLASINRRADKKAIASAMELVGLDSKSKKSVGKYSLGMRQRLGIAQAIMEDPEILILDEPMNSLDEQAVEEIRNLILQLKEKGKLIIITSHNKEDIEFLCDEVYQIRQGMIERIEKI
jgi:ABC-2 type transport system ATP-binding protein